MSDRYERIRDSWLATLEEYRQERIDQNRQRDLARLALSGASMANDLEVAGLNPATVVSVAAEMRGRCYDAPGPVIQRHHRRVETAGRALGRVTLRQEVRRRE